MANGTTTAVPAVTQTTTPTSGGGNECRGYIEDITITSTLGGLPEITYLDLRFAIGELPQASVGVMVGEADKVFYNNAPAFTNDSVGQEITITWDSKGLTLFKGFVTGVGMQKSNAGVAYNLYCTGGPLALSEATVATAGWYPLGLESDLELQDAFLDIVEDWTSVKELVTKMANQLTNKELPRASHAAKNQLDQVSSALINDINNISEASVLSQFWGIVGDFANLDLGIRERMRNMLSVGLPNHTYLQFIKFICSEIQCQIVPWADKTFLIPKMHFTHAPQSNVVFPTMLTSFDMQSDPFTAPAQVIVPLEWYDDMAREDMEEAIIEGSAYAFPESPEPNNPFGIFSYMVVDPPPWGEHITTAYYKEGIQNQADKFEVHDDVQPENQPIVLTEQKLREYAKNYAAYMFVDATYKHNRGRATLVFHPPMLPGFCAYVIDGQKGYNSWGLVTSVHHQVTQTSAQTSIELSHVVSMEDNITIDNPLYQAVIPSGAGIAGEVAGVAHVAPGAALSHAGMDNAAAAASFTGR